jgi:hypothetical protein
MSNLEGCQLPCVPRFSLGPTPSMEKSLKGRIKRLLAVPWNRHVKKWLKRAYARKVHANGGTPAQAAARAFAPEVPFQQGDWVRVRLIEDIRSTLDPFKELKGCAFLPDMEEYCGTRQRVFRSMQNFMDERDYKLKKVRGVILLENVYCNGTPTFGACDRCCLLFWREEWLERVAG